MSLLKSENVARHDDPCSSRSTFPSGGPVARGGPNVEDPPAIERRVPVPVVGMGPCSPTSKGQSANCASAATNSAEAW